MLLNAKSNAIHIDPSMKVQPCLALLSEALVPDSATYSAALLACERLGSFEKAP